MTVCPHCGKRGVKIGDRIRRESTELVFDYCGYCGKNWPKDRRDPPDKFFDSNIGAIIESKKAEA